MFYNKPILFLVFNRPDTTRQVFNEIKKIKPKKLYVAADGPRDDVYSDILKTNNVRDIIKQIDWDCDLRTNFRENNLGCKYAVSTAIDWFFKNEEAGVILEDDCLPSQDFFQYCEDLLERFQNNLEITMISGNNFQDGVKRGDSSYYFSKYTHIWGWATWKNRWKYNDVELTFWPKWRDSFGWRNLFKNRREMIFWENIFDRVYLNKIDTWDYSWLASSWYNDGMTIIPNSNLVTNIGFTVEATHTKSNSNILSNRPLQSIGEIRHNDILLIDDKADEYTFKSYFNNHEKKVHKILKWLKNI